MIETWSKLWHIGTRLVNDEEIEKWNERGYVPSLPGSNVYFEADSVREAVLAVYKPLYLDCAYNELDAYLDRTYEGQCFGHSFQYRLKRNRVFIEEIEHGLLARVAKLYQINRPLIFAPDARRAVDICITEGLTLEELLAISPKVKGKPRIDESVLKTAGWKIDILGGILRTNQHLILTNVQLSDKAQDFANDGEDKDGQRYFDVQGNLSNRTLIFPDTPTINDDVQKIVAGSNEHSFRVYVNGDVDLRKYRTITFGETTADDWVNIMQNGDNLPRLRTAGDINNFCQRFLDNDRGFNCRFLCVIQPQETAPANIIRRYEQRDRYPDWGETQELFQAMRYRPICYLRFAGKGKYLGDWAEYVLAACEHEYPEFSWAGVNDDDT